MFLFGLVLALFLGQAQMESIRMNRQILSPFFVASKVSITAKVHDIHKETDHDRVYTMKLVTLGAKNIEKNIFFRATFDKNLDIFEGDILTFETPLYPIRGEKRYQMYMYHKSLYFQIFPLSFQLVSHEPPWVLFSFLSSLREHLLSQIEHSFPKNEALFLGGILLGARETMDKELVSDFNASGLTHIIAVSGANITIIILFCSFCLAYFPPVVRMICLGLSVSFFVLLVGLSPPVVRAACMGIVMYMVTLSGRQVHTLALLCLILFVFTLYNPFSLVYDISLQLSFLAVMGVIYFYPLFEKIFSFLPKFLMIKESLLMTISATITTLPIMILNFGTFSLVAPLSNLFVGWTLPIAMLGGFLSILFSYISSVLHSFFSFGTFLFLRYDIFIVQFFGNLSWSTLEVDFGSFGGLFFLSYYGVLFFFYIYATTEKK